MTPPKHTQFRFLTPPSWADVRTLEWVEREVSRLDAYIRHLPEFLGNDCLATAAAQAGWIASELRRAALAKARPAPEVPK